MAMERSRGGVLGRVPHLRSLSKALQPWLLAAETEKETSMGWGNFISIAIAILAVVKEGLDE